MGEAPTSTAYSGPVPGQRPPHRPFRERRRRQRYKRWTAREDLLLAALREEGKSWAQIAKRLHRSIRATRKRASREGLAEAGWILLVTLRQELPGVSYRNLEDLARELGVEIQRAGGARHRVVSPADAELLRSWCHPRPGEVAVDVAAPELGWTPKHLAKLLRLGEAQGRRLPGRLGWVVDARWFEAARADARWHLTRVEQGLLLPVSRAAALQGYSRRRLKVPPHRRLVRRARHFVQLSDLRGPDCANPR